MSKKRSDFIVNIVKLEKLLRETNLCALTIDELENNIKEADCDDEISEELLLDCCSLLSTFQILDRRLTNMDKIAHLIDILNRIIPLRPDRSISIIQLFLALQSAIVPLSEMILMKHFSIIDLRDYFANK